MSRAGRRPLAPSAVQANVAAISVSANAFTVAGMSDLKRMHM
jgi:hypothetical protein